MVKQHKVTTKFESANPFCFPGQEDRRQLLEMNSSKHKKGDA
jgi:hypothetical protein